MQDTREKSSAPGASANKNRPASHVDRGSLDVPEVWRRELKRSLGMAEPDSEELRTIFAEGVDTVRDLESSGQISEETAETLLRTMAVLYLEGLVVRLSDRIVGRRPLVVPDFIHWMIHGVE